MNLSKFVNKETLINVGAGTAGALATLPLKKFVFTKIPVINKSEMRMDIANIALGIALGAFSSKKAVKMAGLGMAFAGGFSLAKPLVQKAGIGAVNDGKGVMLQGVNEGSGVLLGNASAAAGDDYYAGSAMDTSSAEAGEMDF